MLRALIFDVDGTLAETEEVHRQAFNATFAASGLGWQWSPEDYTRLLRTTGGKERMRSYRQEIGAARPTDAEIAELHAAKTERYAGMIAAGGLALRPGVRELVAGARRSGLRLAIATTTNRPNVDSLCAACWGQPAEALFEVIAAGDEVSRKKPAPDVYTLALERLRIAPEQAVALEDSRNGLLSAQGAGIATLAVPSSFTGAEDFSEAQWRADSYQSADLPDFLRDVVAASNQPARTSA
ncbi:HAD family hydrolase [Aliiruegeria lutimaris]|uniref:Haloacid dehalogenase superfamily, subfamily IA, variant 3 with third motif having DD or ED n=1 Tax=Aliiruegeria lutimaris TaxID=571298 RepID=A0A1G8X524_9RHOB|nr:HAD family hydrolase [Aliiruegeria lutimaris]SDJ85653.1 haloacid dehalogenase superfamily, subfamily IA, variant 3 with third motif having DD or ED [Aliiruegeria lutimaris]